MDSEESRRIAKAILEELGGLEYIAQFNFPRAVDPKDSSEKSTIWEVYLCGFCHAPTWKCSKHSKGEEDGWRISDFSPWDLAFETCNACEGSMELMSNPAQVMMRRQALAILTLFGKRLTK